MKEEWLESKKRIIGNAPNSNIREISLANEVFILSCLLLFALLISFSSRSHSRRRRRYRRSESDSSSGQSSTESRYGPRRKECALPHPPNPQFILSARGVCRALVTPQRWLIEQRWLPDPTPNQPLSQLHRKWLKIHSTDRCALNYNDILPNRGDSTKDVVWWVLWITF